MISLIIIVVVAVNVHVCGKLRSIPFQNPASCPSLTVGGYTYDSFFNSMTMRCTPCSQSFVFQQRSDDGQLFVKY